MKIKKIIILVFSFFLLGTLSVSATTVSDSVSIQVTTAVDCVGKYSECVNGIETYGITIAAKDGGNACSAVNGATRNCGTKTDCVGDWGSCINGIETYGIITPAKDGGNACPSSSGENRACVDPTQMSGVLNATSCTINIGESSCSVPYSWEVTNPQNVGGSAVTESTGGKTLATGDSGSKSLTLSYGGFTTLFLYNNEVPLANKYVEAKICTTNCTWNPTTGLVEPSGPAVDGAWTAWSPASVCPDGGTQTRTCIPGVNGGVVACPDDGLGVSRTVPSGACPSLDISFTWKGKKLLSTEKVVYNGIANVLWESKNVDSCSCEYSDSVNTTNRSCTGNQNSPYITPALKRDTTYTISCSGAFGSISKSVKIPVDKMNPNYIEQ
jgi:hypothetical protein